MSLDTLVGYWFPDNGYQDFWFDGSNDHEIKEKFGSFLKEHEANPPELADLSDDQLFGYILLYDQITRNISRIDGTNHQRNDKMALLMASMLLEKKHDEKFPFHKRMFILLPYRHSRTTENLDFVVKRLEYYKTIETTNKHYESLYQRFFIATLRDYSKVTDTIEVIEDATNFSCGHPLFDSVIHDEVCNDFAHFPSLEIVKEMEKNPLYKSVENYIEERNIRKIGLSLSGGVDSNVLMYILYQLRLRGKLDVLVAVHIDYGNRDTSQTEAKYLTDVCLHFGIPMVTRRINHMKRASDSGIDRKFYEDETKKIRFGAYKYANEKYCIQGVCLGHHKDDMTENVFMNLLRGKDLLDLFVMTPFLVFDGVNIMRPMLDHHKDAIYDISHEHGIMYFKDTTPEWSFRGLMRTKIFPVITKFDQSMLLNLGNVGKMSLEWKDVVESTSIEPILKTLHLGKTGFSLFFENGYSKLSYVFWSRLMAQLFHGRNVRMISHKNLRTFIEWAKCCDGRKCSLTNGLTAYGSNQKLYFFDQKMISSDKKTITVNHDGSPIEINTSNWKIKIEPTVERIESPMTYDDLLNGVFCYSEPVHPSNEMQISYTLGSKDRTKKLFRKISKFSNCVPKCSSGPTDFTPTGFVKITINYIIMTNCN
jgi:tRNA(Ile)-lysidine synthetase-like protein